MQTKSSYRVLKWTFLTGMAMSLATACVVSSGDGNNDDTEISEGGDGGTNNNNAAGASSGGGGNTNASGTGGSSAGTGGSTGGSTDDGGEAGATTGGMPSTFVPGECQVDAALVPAEQPLSLCDAATSDNACIACLKENACAEVLVCFGSDPTTACSTGMTEGADGQFECIRKCFADGVASAVDADELLEMCAGQCDDCGTGGVNDETTDLINAANDPAKCQSECFPFE